MNPSEDRVADLEVENAALRAQVSELPILRAQITALPSRWLALPPLFLLRTPGQADLGRSGAVSRPSRGDAACGESSADWVASSAWSTRCATSPPVARSRRPRPLSSLIGIGKAGHALCLLSYLSHLGRMPHVLIGDGPSCGLNGWLLDFSFDVCVAQWPETGVLCSPGTRRVLEPAPHTWRRADLAPRP